jgi:hypothetical protein
MVATDSTTNISVCVICFMLPDAQRLKDGSVIFCDNGRSGFMGEHSCLDGTATLRMNEFILGALDHGKISASQGSSDTSGLPEPKELQFEIDNKSEEFIKQAEKNFDKLIGDHELEVGSSCFAIEYTGISSGPTL